LGAPGRQTAQLVITIASGMTPDDGFRRDRDPLRRRNARLAAVAPALSLGVLVAIGIWLSRPHPAVTQPLAQATPTPTTTPMPSPTPLPTPTPAPVPCNAGLQLTGAYNDCAQSLSNQSQPCQVSTNSLFMVTHLHGSQHDYLLYIQVGNRTSPLPGVYVLPSPQSPPFSNTNATPTVAVRDSACLSGSRCGAVGLRGTAPPFRRVCCGRVSPWRALSHQNQTSGHGRRRPGWPGRVAHRALRTTSSGGRRPPNLADGRPSSDRDSDMVADVRQRAAIRLGLGHLETDVDSRARMDCHLSAVPPRLALLRRCDGVGSSREFDVKPAG